MDFSNITASFLLKLSEYSQAFGLGNLAKPTWDVFFILFLFVAAFLYGMNLGRNRMWVIILSTYVSLLVIRYLPYRDEIYAMVGIERHYIDIGVFVIVLAVFFILFARSAFGIVFSSRLVIRSWFHVILFAILHVGLVVAVLVSLLSVELQETLSPTTIKLFGGQDRLFWWIAISALAMGLIRKRKDKK